MNLTEFKMTASRVQAEEAVAALEKAKSDLLVAQQEVARLEELAKIARDRALFWKERELELYALR